jgi:hypothetical protein
VSIILVAVVFIPNISPTFPYRVSSCLFQEEGAHDTQ